VVTNGDAEHRLTFGYVWFLAFLAVLSGSGVFGSFEHFGVLRLVAVGDQMAQRG
jgi:hypothetical protein